MALWSGRRFRRRRPEPPPFDPLPLPSLPPSSREDVALRPSAEEYVRWQHDGALHQIRLVLLSWDPVKRQAFEAMIADDEEMRLSRGERALTLEEYRLMVERFALSTSGAEEVRRLLGSLGSLIPPDVVTTAKIADGAVRYGLTPENGFGGGGAGGTVNLQSGTGVASTSPERVPRGTSRRPDVPEQRMYVDDE